VENTRPGEVDLVMNTPWGAGAPRLDGYEIRTAAVSAGIPCLTTVQAAAAAVQGIEELVRNSVGVRPLQDFHASLAAWREDAR
jgi:carbamoyl-phosphate synthase large subunit